MSDERGARRETRGTPDRFDLAVDRAVREMLDVEPPAGFDARVRRRIVDTDRAAAGSKRKVIWAALPLGAAATLTLALWLPLRTTDPLPQPSAPVATARPRPSIEPPAPQPGVPRTRPAARGPAVVAARRVPAVESERTIAAAALETEDTSFAVPPLEVPEALAIRDLVTPPPASLPSTAPQPMQIRALEISALSEMPPERRKE